MRAIDAGIITAAAEPCTKRATIRVSRPGARPQAADAATKPTMPMMNARRAPRRSLKAPAARSRAANINV